MSDGGIPPINIIESNLEGDLFVVPASAVFEAVNKFTLQSEKIASLKIEDNKEELANIAIQSIATFYRRYAEVESLDCVSPESMANSTPTMIARNALWLAFKPKETQNATDAHAKGGRTRREAQIQVQDDQLEAIRKWDYALENLEHIYRNGHGTLHAEKPIGSGMELDDFERCILEVRTIVDRLFLEFISGIDLNPTVNFNEIQNLYTKKFEQKGYKYIRPTKYQSDLDRNAKRIMRVKGRWGTRFGEVKITMNKRAGERNLNRPSRRADRKGRSNYGREF